ncbi:unnamed protein product [Prorocentrum cordatum]|uniref:B30.2/SPRY domain-containing protein n=1 Tax=Prorocentrum cordatum TaxID=2364126 RepID=A0ABN9W913_9DINO|nr:unnamed protein product [Polarella glacialis]
MAAPPGSKRPREDGEEGEGAAADLGWSPHDVDEEVELEFDHLCRFYWGAGCASTPSRAWIGAPRGRPGIVWGSYVFEVKVLGEKDLVRVGWSQSGSSRAVGSEPGSFGFGGSGKKSCANRFADYGRSFGQGDVVGCLLNRDQRFVAFTLNGEYLGRAHSIPRDLDGVPLYPSVCAREAFRVAGYFGHGHTRSGGLPFGYQGYWPLATATDEDRAAPDAGPGGKRARAAPGPEATPEELEARRERALRFQQAGAPAPGTASCQDRFAEGVRKAASTSERPVEGVCTELEKPFLRLTTLPRASDLRPAHVLQQAFALVQERWRQHRDWAWAGEMLRSIRQDLTVQMIRSSFTVEVYELSARLALEAGDFKQFDQSFGPLEELHADAQLGASANAPEFLACRLLYLVLQGGGLALSVFLSRQAACLRAAARAEDPSVAPAWRLRAALAAGRTGQLPAEWAGPAD